MHFSGVPDLHGLKVRQTLKYLSKKNSRIKLRTCYTNKHTHKSLDS